MYKEKDNRGNNLGEGRNWRGGNGKEKGMGI